MGRKIAVDIKNKIWRNKFWRFRKKSNKISSLKVVQLLIMAYSLFSVLKISGFSG